MYFLTRAELLFTLCYEIPCNKVIFGFNYIRAHLLKNLNVTDKIHVIWRVKVKKTQKQFSLSIILPKNKQINLPQKNI